MYIVKVSNRNSLHPGTILQRYIQPEELNTFSNKQIRGLQHIFFYKDKEILLLNKKIRKLNAKSKDKVNYLQKPTGKGRTTSWRLIKKLMPKLCALQDHFTNGKFMDYLIQNIEKIYVDLKEKRHVEAHTKSLKQIDKIIKNKFNDREKILKSEIWRQLHWVSHRKFEGLCKNVWFIFLFVCVQLD